MKHRILFVAMAHSVHTARRLANLPRDEWDVHLFPVTELPLHPQLRDVTVYTWVRQPSDGLHPSVRQRCPRWPLRRGQGRMAMTLRSLCPERTSPEARLARTIRRLKPHVVQSMEMQQAGYLTLAARERLGSDRFPPWIYSCMGNDLYFCGPQPEHTERIRAVLAACDYFTTDCQRDAELVRQYGFTGEVLGVFPGPWGADLEAMRQYRRPGPIAQRRVIAVKGREQPDWTGRAVVALQAIHRCADLLAEYEIVIHTATPPVVPVADFIARETGLSIHVLEESPHEEVRRGLGQARSAVGCSVSDGTPNTMLEAMVMGAFPIQSDTVSTGEWITDGENGLLVPPEDSEAVAVALRRALDKDEMMERAAQLNAELMDRRIARSVLQPKLLEAYRRVLAQGKARPARSDSDMTDNHPKGATAR